jgi:hypothetical protein
VECDQLCPFKFSSDVEENMRLCRDLCVEAKNKVPPIHAHIMRMPTQIMSTRSQILGMPTQLMRAQSK